MNRGISTRLAQALRAVVLTAVLITTACGAAGNATGAVDVKVTAPAPNQDVTVGVSIMIKADVSGANITRVDVLIDGAPYAILTTDDKTKGMPTFPVNVPWAPTTTGLHVVQFIVYGSEAKVLLKTDPLIFKASGVDGAATATPAPTSAPMPSDAATPVAQPTPATAITSTTLVTDTAPTTQAVVVVTPATSADASLTIVSEVANVRSGPDTSYPVIGQLKRDATAAVRGKTVDGTWWQIAYASASDGVGWVRADLAQANLAANSVAVVSAPVLPTAAPVTITVVAPTVVAQATITPTAAGRACDSNTPEWRGSDARYPFCVAKNLTWFDNQDGAHRYENTRDVPLSLSWDLWGVDSVWMVFEQDDSGYCDYTKKSAKTFSEPVAQAGTYNFNVKDFPGGATLRLFLSIKRKDGQIVQFGDKRLCIY